MTEAQREVAAEIAAGPRGEVRGPFIALMHHPELARRCSSSASKLRWGSRLPPRLVELAVLITARPLDLPARVEHAREARPQGRLDGAIVEAIAEGRETRRIAARGGRGLCFLSRGSRRRRVGDAAFAAVRDRFGLDGALELLALSGYYSLMAMVLNTAGLPLADNAAPPLSHCHEVMRCDAHFHVFGPAERYPARDPKLRYPPPLAPLADYLRLARPLGLERFVFVQPSAYGRDNRCMLDAMQETPNSRGIVGRRGKCPGRRAGSAA